ncbi:6-phosphogluconolactonase [Aestuariimicrobium sp. Y1814]|uniref:6-phosphogluconolactonase n=1 Tax=Aestuariimicrobium sp. Y1814 TaxID=3418742 RepID=UPI003DA72F2F
MNPPSSDPGIGADRLHVFDSHEDLGRAAANLAAAAISQAVDQRGSCTLMLAAAPSQAPLLEALVAMTDLPWDRVTLFHMDDYVGLPPQAPQLFARWLLERLDAVPYARFHALDSQADDPVAEAERYGALVQAAQPFDLAFVGVGVNGHLAFNEPGDTDFDDPRPVRLIDLEVASRQQQVDEGLFDDLASVPQQALTVTLPTLLGSRTCLLSALGAAKAQAVKDMLTGPVGPQCPASALRHHPDLHVHLDAEAAALLGERQ